MFALLIVVRAGVADTADAATLRAACDGALEGAAEGAFETVDLACEGPPLGALLGAVLFAFVAEETTVGAFDLAADLVILTTLLESPELASIRSGR